MNVYPPKRIITHVFHLYRYICDLLVNYMGMSQR